MSNKFHGITSITLVGIAMVIAGFVLFRVSLVLGLVFVVIAAVAPQVVLYAYCAKCPCKVRCAHVLPGRAAMRYKRQPGPYTTAELTAMMLAMLILIGFPQYWLWQHTALFIAFWVLTGIALIQIRAVVCRTCTNVFCPLHSQYAAPNRP